MIKYKTTSTGAPHIVKINVLRETDKCVFLATKSRGCKEIRVAKSSTYENYFDTFEEAKEFLAAKSRNYIASVETTLAYERDQLAKIEALQDV